MASYITEEDVRMFLLDRSIEDNGLDLDLSFSHEEIAEAMRRCAREFNSIPPRISSVSPESLPNDTNLFLDGIAEQLYLSKVANMARNDFDYTAGGVTTNIEAKRLKHFTDLIQLHRQRFRDTATSIKVQYNWEQAYGTIG